MARLRCVWAMLWLASLLVCSAAGCGDSTGGAGDNNTNGAGNSNDGGNSNNGNVNSNDVPSMTVEILSPASGASVMEGRALDFVGSVQGGTPPYTASWSFDGAAQGRDQLDAGDVTLTSPGPKTITLTVTDAADALASAEIGVTVEDVFGDLIPWYGNLHSHSGISDGDGTLDEVLTWARDVAGVDFYATTDHSEQIFGSEWDDMQAATDAFNQDGVFVALRGFEWSHPINGHMVIYDTSEFNSAYTALWITVIYDWLDEQGALAQYNHPGRELTAFDDFDYYAHVGDNMFAIETGNKGDGNNDGEFLPYYIQALDKGWRLAPTSNQDNHSLSMNSHRSVFLAPTLSRQSLLDAMEQRRFYSSDDPNIAIAFRADDHWLGDIYQVSAGHQQELMVKVVDDEPIELLELVTAGGTVVDQHIPAADSTYVLWYPSVTISASTWYFLRVTSTDTLDGDGPQQIAVTAPIWFVVN